MAPSSGFITRRIAEFQGVQWLLAHTAKDTAAARLLTHAAALRLDSVVEVVFALQ